MASTSTPSPSSTDPSTEHQHELEDRTDRLETEGNYPFVTHAFADMVEGALGVLHTEGGPKAAGGH
jgi:hypothetical protein